MLNTPRSNKIPKFVDYEYYVNVRRIYFMFLISNSFNTNVPYVPEKRKAMPTLVGDLVSGIVDEVTELPECNADVQVDRLPSPLPFHKDCSKDNIDLEYVSVIKKQFFFTIF